jgi:hypothetical protein
MEALTAENRLLKAEVAALKQLAPAASITQQPQQQVLHEHEVQLDSSASTIGEPEQLSGRLDCT